MDRARELDLRVLFADQARALEELFFCTLHPDLTGRREAAIRTYAEVCVKIAKLTQRA